MSFCMELEVVADLKLWNKGNSAENKMWPFSVLLIACEEK